MTRGNCIRLAGTPCWPPAFLRRGSAGRIPPRHTQRFRVYKMPLLQHQRPSANHPGVSLYGSQIQHRRERKQGIAPPPPYLAPLSGLPVALIHPQLLPFLLAAVSTSRAEPALFRLHNPQEAAIAFPPANNQSTPLLVFGATPCDVFVV